MLTFFWVCIECKSWNTRSTWFMQFVHSPLFSLSLPLSLSMINQSKCDNCTDLWRTGKITSTQTTNKIGAKKQKILLYCFLQFFVWQNPMWFFFVCLVFFISFFLSQTYSHLKLQEIERCHMSFSWHLSLRKAERSGLGALAGGPAIHHGDRVVNGLCNSVSDEWPWKGVSPLTLLWSIQ